MFFCKKKYLKSYQQALGYSWSLRYNGAEVGYFANDQVIVSETVIAVVAYDDMVEHVQVEQAGDVAAYGFGVGGKPGLLGDDGEIRVHEAR